MKIKTLETKKRRENEKTRSKNKEWIFKHKTPETHENRKHNVLKNYKVTIIHTRYTLKKKGEKERKKT